MDEDYEDYANSDDEFDEKTHAKLLANVLNLTNKQHVKKPSRTEPTLKVSEYDLVRSGKNLHLKELTKALKKRRHAETEKKVRVVDLKAKTLPRPLEKPQADRLRRTVAYQDTRTRLDRWEPIVTSLRAASQITYPLEAKVNLAEDRTASGRWRMRSDLEKELDALETHVEIPTVDEEFPLTMAEMLERRGEAARLRARQSHSEAKARRQNRIKSKKYHRVQRREKAKAQMKEFERLQATDPEAALRKLDEIEKARADERASLKHRSTGKWARSKQIRAKYDKDSRQVLAQQLAISRDLTQKLRRNSDSEAEGEELDADGPTTTRSSDNPWVDGAEVKVAKEVSDFVDGYRKYWDAMNGGINETHVKKATLEKKSVTSEDEQENVGNDRITHEESVGESNGNKKMRKEEGVEERRNVGNKRVTKEESVDERKKVGNKRITNKEYLEDEKKNIGNKTISNGDSVGKKENAGNKRAANEENAAHTVNVVKKRLAKKVSEGAQTDEMTQTNGQTATNVERRGKKQIRKDCLKAQLSNSSIPKAATSKKNRASLKNKSIDDGMIVGTTNWVVSTDIDTELIKLDNKLRKKLREKYKSLSSETPAKTVERIGKPKKAKRPDLSIPVKATRPIIDEALNESSKNGAVQTPQVVKLKSILDRPVENIDPENFVRAKPTTRLDSEIPDLLSFEDNEEATEQKGVIAEAFEDDNVADDFRGEKATEIEKLRPKPVDLTLPGWGSWGGRNLKIPTRKRRRFIVKLPQPAPRKDKNRGDLIVNENAAAKAKPHLVSEVPFPFKTVGDFEASIRAPVGNTFVPETAFGKLIQPAVITKMGTIIEPMTEDILLRKRKR